MLLATALRFVALSDAPPGWRDQNRDGRPDGRGERDRPATVITLPSQPVQPYQPGRRDDYRRDDDRRNDDRRNDDRRARPAPVIQAPAPVIMQQPAAPAPVAEVGRPPREDRFIRREREPRQRAPEPVAQPFPPQAPISRPAPQPVQVQQAPAARPMPQLERTAPPGGVMVSCRPCRIRKRDRDDAKDRR